MINNKTLIKVIDNSGAVYVKCIKVLKSKAGYGKTNYACVGDIILTSVRFYIPNKKIKKGNLFKAIIVKTKRSIDRETGFLSFDNNGVLLLDKKMQLLGTKIFGPIAFEARSKKFSKLLTFAKVII